MKEEDKDSYYERIITLIKIGLEKLESGAIGEKNFFEFVLILIKSVYTQENNNANCTQEFDDTSINDEIKMIKGTIEALEENKINDEFALYLIYKRYCILMGNNTVEENTVESQKVKEINY